MQFAQPEFMDTFFQYIFGFFDQLFSTPLQPYIPWGPGDWFFVIYTLFWIAVVVVVRRRAGGGGRARTYQV